MKNENIQPFIDGALRYFEHIPNADVDVGVPYLVNTVEPVGFDLTGLIQVSGKMNGCVYFSSAKTLLRQLLICFGQKDFSYEYLVDLAGEIANTISGNVRKEFGKDFQISVPKVINGIPEGGYFSDYSRSYVVPITWNAFPAAIVVNLEEKYE